MGENHSYIELFARNTTPGWDVWGNEVTNLTEQPVFECLEAAEKDNAKNNQ